MVPEKMLELKAQGLLASQSANAKSARLLARAFYKEMREEGFTPQQVLAASGELLDMVTTDLREARDAA
jgi:hypothetical protein